MFFFLGALRVYELHYGESNQPANAHARPYQNVACWFVVGYRFLIFATLLTFTETSCARFSYDRQTYST